MTESCLVTDGIDKQRRCYVELRVQEFSEVGGHDSRRRAPQFMCRDTDTAEQVVTLIEHAHAVYEQLRHTVGAMLAHRVN